MKPIPKKLLIHTVTLFEKMKEDSWGKEELDAGKQIRFVRMEPSSKIIRDKNGAEVQLAATLFYDCRNSLPRDLDFKVDDIISFNGQKHQVKTVEPLYDEKKLHHYELGLIRYA